MQDQDHTLLWVFESRMGKTSTNQERAPGRDSPGVGGGQSAMGGGSDDLEGGAKCVESPGGELGRARGELEEASQLLLGKAGHHSPEPLHNLRWSTSGSPSHLHLIMGWLLPK